jgi:predicted MPP superfamily phosphohydrolase
MIGGLEIGATAPLLVREEHVDVAGATSRTSSWRLLFASDLHLRASSARRVEELVQIAAARRPDVVLFGGDLLDARNGLLLLEACVRRLATLAPVAAVAGNHDDHLGLEAVRDAVRRGGGHWLADESLRLTLPERRPLELDGRIRVRESSERAPLRETPVGGSPLKVFVSHYPWSAAAAARAGYDLALAGHLHGGQCVLWQRGTRLYPGAWLSRFNGLRFAIGDATLLVSRGAADTFPVRFRCPREVVLCRIR